MLDPNDDQVGSYDSEDDSPVARANPVVTGPVSGEGFCSRHLGPSTETFEDLQNPCTYRDGEFVEVLLSIRSEENNH